MAEVLFDDVPAQRFVGRLYARDQWRQVEVTTAVDIRASVPNGVVIGVGCRVWIEGDSKRPYFWVLVDIGRSPVDDEATLRNVKIWLPKCAVVIASAVVSGRQAVPESGLFLVGAPDYSKDPQRADPYAFRRRCRFDVLNVLVNCLNEAPGEEFCEFTKLAASRSHTRLYENDDYFSALLYWKHHGYVEVLNRAGDVQIMQVHDDAMMGALRKYSWNEAGLEQEVTEDESVNPLPPGTGHHVFVSHASEDKASVVTPLSNELERLGLRVWVDYRELRLGDRLRQRIDEGLAQSQFGVVIVSPDFFAKRWPQVELDGLVALEMADGRKRILPVWHNVDYEAVAQRSPSLAARLAVKWTDGLAKVADEIVRAVRP